MFPNIALPFAGTPFTVAPRSSRTYVWDAAATDGRYDFTVHGADGFVAASPARPVRGRSRPVRVSRPRWPSTAARAPGWTCCWPTTATGRVTFGLVSNDDGAVEGTEVVPAGGELIVSWPTSAGTYDVTVTADDGAGLVRRYAGTVHPVAAESAPRIPVPHVR